MSFLSEASLAMIPSGYKTSKVYSAIPTSGDGDLTFSRSNDTATRVGPDGLIEKVRTNFCRYSQDFASWVLLGGATRTTGVTDPNGGTTAATIGNIPSGNFSDGISIPNNTMTISAGGKITASVYLKGSGTIGIALERSVSGTYFFETTSVTLTSSWVRYTFSPTIAAAADGFQIYVANFTGSTATSFDIAFVQVEQGDIATDYIATTSAAVSVGPVANVPRLDYLDSSSPRLLLEPQRTNLQIYSENSALWQQPADGLTVVYNTTETLDPAGFNGAEKVTFTGGNGRMFEAIANAVGSVTMSAFVKAGTGNTIRLLTTSTSIFVDFNLTTQTITPTVGTGTITNYGNGWYRVTATGTSATTPEVAQYVFPNTAGQFVYFYGPQFEQGAYATSYIPTLGAAVTRGADFASKTGISSLIGQTEGTLFVEINSSDFESYTQRIFTVSDDTNNNVIGLQLTAANNLVFYVENGGVNQVAITKAVPAITLGQNVKIAAAYKANDFVLYVNGVQVGTDTSGSVPATSVLRYANPTGTTQYIGKVAQTLLFPTRLQNSDLAALTA
jgi:hypothetical protein